MRHLFVLLAWLAFALPALAQVPANPAALIARRDSMTAEIERLQARADSLASLLPGIDEQLRWVPPPSGQRYERVSVSSYRDITVYEAPDEGSTTTFEGRPGEIIVTGYTAGPSSSEYSRPQYYQVWHNGRAGYVRSSELSVSNLYSIRDASQRLSEVQGLPRTVARGTNLQVGPRGGCYYVAASGAKVYVDRTLCGSRAQTPSSYTPSYGTSSGSGGSVQVRGYTRKDGTYVRPHTRSAPRRGGGRG